MPLAPPIDAIQQPAVGIYGLPVGASAGAMVLLTAAQIRAHADLGTLATQSGTFSGTSSGTNTGDQSLAAYLTSAGAASTYVPLTRTLNTLALSADQTFAVGTGGTDFAIASSGTAHTFNIPDASATARGVMTTGTQTIAGAKTFSSDLTSTGNITSVAGYLRMGGPSVVNVSLRGYGSGLAVITNNSQNDFSRLSFGVATSAAPAIKRSGTTFAIRLGDDSADAPLTAASITASGTILTRNGTSPTSIQITNTYTSATSYELLNIKAVAAAAYQIGSAIGSAGGTNRAIEIGHYNSGGTFTSALSIATTGIPKFTLNGLTAFEIRANSIGGSDPYSTAITTRQGFTMALRGDQGCSSHSFYTSGRFGFKSAPLDQADYPERQVDVTFARVNSTSAAVYTTLSGTTPANWLCGSTVITQAVSTTGSPTAFTLTGAVHTTLALSTEATDVNFNLARTVQFATGALTTQRAMRIQAPTYGFVGASTITTASTLSISGPPVAGTNATITNTYALNVESGDVLLAGGLTCGAITASGLIKPQQATTAAAPAYVLGAIYFDTTLNKLRIGGATAWETVTSV